MVDLSGNAEKIYNSLNAMGGRIRREGKNSR